MIEGHQKVSINQFLGIYSRGDTDNIPLNHLADALNIRVDGDDILTRGGSVLAFTKSTVVRARPYRKSGEVTRFLILTSSGDLYDSTDINNAILSLGTMVDFSLTVIYNRAYISPHNRLTGIAGEKLYVYDGSGQARAAAGIAPTGFTLAVADSALSGSLEAGVRLFAVAYETASGFITTPGPAVFTQHTAAGGKRVDISSIPVGPAGTVARHIICTKMIDDYNGDQDAQEYYFAYGGRIGNNTATTVTLDFFDAQLVESADYLFSQLTEIPAALGLIAYQNSLVTWGENLYPNIVRVSKQGEPESFNGESGYINVDNNDNSGVKSAVEYRGQLVITKSTRTYATQRNVSAEPIFWECTSVDKSIGTEVYGIGAVLDTTGSFTDYFLALTPSGLLTFNGTYSLNLADKIRSIWNRINAQYISTAEIVIDPFLKRIYCSVPLDAATSPSHILCCDYSNGFAAESVHWYRWSFPVATKSIALDVDYTTKKAVFYYGSTNIYKLDETALDDAGIAIDSYIKTSGITFRDDEGLNTFTGLRLRISGSGSLQISVMGEDDSNIKTQKPYTLATSVGKPILRPLNYVSERCFIKLRVSNSNEWFRITSMRVFGLPIWYERPQ